MSESENESTSVNSYAGAPLKDTPAPTPLVPTVHTVFGHWRSTLSGFLTVFLATGAFFSGVPVASLQQHGVTQNMVFWATVACGLAKLYLAMISKDAK